LLKRKFYIYLLKEMTNIFLLSLGTLTFILVLGRLGKLTDLVINKGVALRDIILLIVYSSPPYLTFTLPMAFLLSTIVVLGRLSVENEILALKANGIDLKCLFVPIALIGCIITIIALFNTNALLPQSADLFRNTLLNIVKKGITIEGKEGVFNDTVPGVVIYVDRVDTKKRILRGILVSDDRNPAARLTVSAGRGIINLDPVTLDLHFVLEDGSLQSWEKADDAYKSVSFANYTFTMNLASMLPQTAGLRKRPFEMDTKELRGQLAQADVSKRYDLLLEIFKRISIPLSSLAFVLVTIPLGIRRSVEGRFSGVVYSLLLFVFYYILMALTENMGKASHLPAVITAFAPNFTMALIGLYLLRNLNQEEPATALQALRRLWVYHIEKTR
jgi:lipopolysaccharide export system permease protein